MNGKLSEVLYMDIQIERVQWIDSLRALSIILVVLCHATESVYSLNLDGVKSLSFLSKIICFTCFSLGRLGVPFFLMITGSLLLSKEYDSDKIKIFWKTKWIHLLVCTYIWFAIYDIFLSVYYNESLNWVHFIEELLFLRQVSMGHTWYMPLILGFYISLPFVATILQKYSTEIFLFPIIIYTIYSFGFDTIYLIFHIFNPTHQLAVQLSNGFSGGVYGLYILFGYFIKNGGIKKIKTSAVVTITMTAFSCTVLLQIWFYHKGYAYNVWYNNLLLLITSIGVFELSSRSNPTKPKKFVSIISKYSFAIYLTHFIIKELIEVPINSMSINNPLKITILGLLCFVISLTISVIISKIPTIGKYILYMN